MRCLLVVLLAACGNSAAGGPVVDAIDGPTAMGRILFLDRNGGTYTPAATDDARENLSTVLTSGRAVPVPTVVEVDWTSYVACLQSKFAAFDLTITDRDPGTTPHSELVVVDNPNVIGEPAGTASVSPTSCDPVDNAIVFQMWDASFGRCVIGAQVIGVSLGLDHAFSCPDVMTFLDTCGNPDTKTFTDADVSCGETSARACRCRTAASQNSFQYLLATLGPRP